MAAWQNKITNIEKLKGEKRQAKNKESNTTRERFNQEIQKATTTKNAIYANNKKGHISHSWIMKKN